MYHFLDTSVTVDVSGGKGGNGQKGGHGSDCDKSKYWFKPYATKGSDTASGGLKGSCRILETKESGRGQHNFSVVMEGINKASKKPY